MAFVLFFSSLRYLARDSQGCTSLSSQENPSASSHSRLSDKTTPNSQHPIDFVPFAAGNFLLRNSFVQKARPVAKRVHDAHREKQVKHQIGQSARWMGSGRTNKLQQGPRILSHLSRLPSALLQLWTWEHASSDLLQSRQQQQQPETYNYVFSFLFFPFWSFWNTQEKEKRIITARMEHLSERTRSLNSLGRSKPPPLIRLWRLHRGARKKKEKERKGDDEDVWDKGERRKK